MPLQCKVCKSLGNILVNMSSEDWEIYQYCDCGKRRIDDEVSIRFVEVSRK